MPGLILYASPTPDVATTCRVAASLQARGERTREPFNLLSTTPTSVVAISSYDEYPFETIQIESTTFYVEGRVYSSRSQFLAALSRLALALTGHGALADPARDLLTDTDGEFIIIGSDAGSGDVVLLVDWLGRLPLYTARSSSLLIAARRLSQVLHLLGKRVPDPYGVAQQLLFGYT